MDSKKSSLREYQTSLELMALCLEHKPTPNNPLRRAYTLTGSSKQEEPKTPLDIVDMRYHSHSDVIMAEGPEEGLYALSIDHANKEVYHAWMPCLDPSQQVSRGLVDNLKITCEDYESI